MKAKEFWQYFNQNNNRSKSKISSLLLVTFLVFGVFAAAVNFISGQGSLVSITENEIKREKDFITQYLTEEAHFRKEHGNSARLTPRSEIEIIQNELIQKTKAYHMDVTSVQSIQTEDKHGMEFEMGFTGTWGMTVQYMRELKESTGLISILSCSMNPKHGSGNLVETKLKYKIYVE